MSQEEHVVDEDARSTAVQASQPSPHEEDEWLQEPLELPPRPRRRLLSPIPLALLGVLLLACGFIGGVLVEKGETASSSSGGSAAAGLASRFAALRGGATGIGARSGAAGATSGFGGVGGSGGLTAGQVAYLAGNTLYVTNAEGTTVKVKTSPATSVTKTVKATVKGIHPGETVTVTGATGSNGAVSAESIKVGSSGGGLGALFGGGSARGGAGGGSARGSTTGGEPALFGG